MVAFGANEAVQRKPEINTELRKSEKKMRRRLMMKQVVHNHESRFQDSRPNITIDTLPDTAVQESPLEKQISVDQPKRDHHKRGEDAVTAGRERFLPRKRAKQQ
ncbi:nuclear speckle splicing regulatory protein 1-like [Gossypium australe]|uniref:Nuclear speckle splicing regulatory protein 1-like n=1 Tax=Gossypium australe TaxID=47621 RepID=A0A5B6XAH7_9ROSI|nr:nuclear speckle splicing regulatory protein 1-like [Gossypium australe]